ncbi:MAG: hypothetical protein BWY67_02492 [Bacteroidetes bacterium ADurb.Bin397]|nr:MAG: hypothetical protein BWY67_02492 [Bacteroidetes bacterium ADurb.Bin397]
MKTTQMALAGKLNPAPTEVAIHPPTNPALPLAIPQDVPISPFPAPTLLFASKSNIRLLVLKPDPVQMTINSFSCSVPQASIINPINSGHILQFPPGVVMFADPNFVPCALYGLKSGTSLK